MTSRAADEGFALLHSVRRSFRALVAATLLLYALVGAGTIYIYENAGQTDNSRCEVTRDFERSPAPRLGGDDG